MSRRYFVLFAIGVACAPLVSALACKRTTGDAGDAPAPSTSLSASTSTGGGGAGSSSVSSVASAWVDARELDPLELHRLADRAGVDALVEVAADEHAGADDRASAISALAYVDDPTSALGTLTRLAASGSDARAELALDTLLTVVPIRSLGEESDPTAWRTCGEDLIAALPILPTARHDKVALVLRMLEGRGAIEAK